ncbi:MAG: hypothetical protein QXF76_04175 [Candidatus Anstonellales archaeon]
MKRREFLSKAGIIGLGTSVIPSIYAKDFPEIITKSRTEKKIIKGELIFELIYVQKGRGPHIYPLAWTTDTQWDAFYSNILIENNLELIYVGT